MSLKTITYPAGALESALADAPNDAVRAVMLAHATTPGECDAEYCPWSRYEYDMCIRSQTHTPNCRCHDCGALDDDGE